MDISVLRNENERLKEQLCEHCCSRNGFEVRLCLAGKRVVTRSRSDSECLTLIPGRSSRSKQQQKANFRPRIEGFFGNRGISKHEFQMKWFLISMFLIAFSNAAVAADTPLSIKVLKTERGGSDTIFLLFSVENISDQRFESTEWSCVFFNKGDPVHEERSVIENVPPRDRAISRVIQDYGGPFDKIQCRFMSSRPRTCPC
jgi:hypothetical protein